MADIGVNAVFPTAKFITTDANGDLNEIVAVDAVASSADIDGLTFTAKTAGASGNDLSIQIVDNVGSGGISYSVSGNEYVISLEEDAGQYSLGGFKADIAGNATDINTAFEVTYTASGTSANKLTSGGFAKTNLSGGTDAISSELTPSKSYLVISTDDIADYDGVEEEADGRKVFYGLLDTATSNITSLSDKPQSLTVSRGNLILLSDSKMRRSYSITATLDILDSDLSSES